MSLIFAQLQMAEMERHERQAGRTQFFFEPEALAVDSDEFSALEDRVIRAVELVKRERKDRASAEERALQAEAELGIQLPRIEALEQAIDGIIKSYVPGPPKGGDLDRAKTQLVADAIYRRDSEYEQASAYGQALAIGLTVDDVQSWPNRIRAVTGDAVRDAATNDLIKREAVTGYLLPAAGP